MKYLASILLLFNLSLCFAQNGEFDKIIKKDFTILEGKILKVNSTEIEFDPNGEIPFLIISRADVNAIIYKDGTKVILTDEPTKDNSTNKNYKKKENEKEIDKTPRANINTFIRTVIWNKGQSTRYYHDENKNKTITINSNYYNFNCNIKFVINRPFVGGSHVKFRDIQSQIIVKDHLGNTVTQKKIFEEGPIQGEFGTRLHSATKYGENTTDFKFDDLTIDNVKIHATLKIEFYYDRQGSFISEGTIEFNNND